MSILNQSISRHGSPSMVASQTGSQVRRKMLIVASGNSSSQSCYKRTQIGAKHSRQSGLLEFIDDNAAKLSGLFREEEFCNFISDHVADVNPEKAFKTVPDDAVFETLTFSFVHSVMEKEGISMIKDKMAGLDILDSETAADTLVVSVSSAVKLQHDQMDQIAKKMQRLTGAAHVNLKNTIDPSLIAGFVISYEKESCHVIDLSVKGQLDQLVAHIESNDQRASNNERCIFMNRES